MENTFNPNHLKITRFKILNEQIYTPLNFETQVIEKFNTQMDFNVGFNLKKKIARSTIEFLVETNTNDETEKAYAKFSFAFIFHVENIAELVELKRKKIHIVNPDLTTAIAAISFSTSRGVLLTRLQSTVLNNYILPIIDPSELKE